MPRPGSTPASATPTRGRPGGTKPQYAIPEGQIDELIAANEELIADKTLAQGAIDFDALCDDHAELEALCPPTPKPTNPLEAAVDKDIANEYKPKIVTLAELDAGLDLYYKALERQAHCKNGSTQYWDAQKEISMRNAMQINLGQHWRAQQDALMRAVLERHTKALLKER